MARAGDLKALTSVLPRGICVLAVGGCSPADVPALKAAGAAGFGVGSDLYRPAGGADAVRESAARWVASVRGLEMPGAVVEVCNPRALIGESPLWRSAQQRLTWVDPMQSKLFIAHAAGVPVGELQLDAQVFAIAALPDGRLAGTLSGSLCEVDEASGHVDPGIDAGLGAGHRFNDLAVDPAGGLWVGSMHKGLLATQGALHYAAQIGAPCRRVAGGLGVPNGMRFDRAGSTLFVIDTLARMLLAYPANYQGGTLGEPTVVTDFLGIPGKPDGLALAPDGTFWVAMWGGACVVRIGSNGSLLESIALPAPHVSSVCVDEHGRVWASTSRMRLSDQQLADFPASGALFLIRG